MVLQITRVNLDCEVRGGFFGLPEAKKTQTLTQDRHP